MDLNELLVRSGQGDVMAFQCLYNLSAPRLLAVCQRIIKQTDVAEEVLQESFIKIWQAAQQFNSQRGQAITWMIAIVRHQAINQLRSQAQRQANIEDAWEDEETESWVSADPLPEHLHELNEQAARLYGCLEHLSLAQRQCLLAAYYEGRSHSELAKDFKKPLGTVKAWIRRGLEQLRGCLQ